MARPRHWSRKETWLKQRHRVTCQYFASVRLATFSKRGQQRSRMARMTKAREEMRLERERFRPTGEEKGNVRE